MSFNWKRSELGGNEIGGGGSTSQLFGGRRSIPTTTFVREDMQNHVDALVEGGERVRVVISFATLGKKILEKYFPEEFQNFCIRAVENCPGKSPDERQEWKTKAEDTFGNSVLPVLLIEDFGTTGLNGPVNTRIPEQKKGQPLFHPTNALTCFFRKNGVSGKTGKQLGNAGLGRIVYYKASAISSKLVYSVPVDLSEISTDDNELKEIGTKPIFFGQSLQPELAERLKDGSEKVYSGYSNLSSGNISDLPMPFGIDDDDAELVEQMRKDFKLVRQPKEAGCSIIIPFPKEQFSAPSITATLVKDFSLPILTGSLEVEVDGHKIDENNIAELSDDENVNQGNRFLRYVVGNDPTHEIDIAATRWHEPLADDVFVADQLKQLAAKYHDNSIVHLKFRIDYSSGSREPGEIIVACQKVPDGTKGRYIVARRELILQKHGYTDDFRSGANAITMVQGDQMGSMLRSSETPSHNEWQAGDINTKECEYPQKLIDFIRTAHANLVRSLSNLDAEKDESIFKDLLPKGRSVSPPDPSLAPFDLDIMSDMQTIKVTRGENVNIETNTKWRFILVYDSVGGAGKARKGYIPGQYDLSAAPHSVVGGKVLGKGTCHFDVEIQDQESFALEVGPCGFTGWADVRIVSEILE